METYNREKGVMNYIQKACFQVKIAQILKKYFTPKFAFFTSTLKNLYILQKYFQFVHNQGFLTSPVMPYLI